MPDDVEQQLEAEKEPEERHEGFISDEHHRQRIGVQHKKYREEARGREKAEERAGTAEKELEKLRATSAEIVIPPVPDRYSDTFEADLAVRDKAIKRQADNDADQTRLAEQRKEEDETRLTEEDAAIKERIAGFDSNMVTHGLLPVETKKAAETVIAYGVSENFQDILLEDPDGPLFVTYLAENPVELEQMNGMTALQLVNHMNGDLRAKVSLLKPQTSNAPDPPITPRGGGAPEQKEDWEKGAVYE